MRSRETNNFNNETKGTSEDNDRIDRKSLIESFNDTQRIIREDIDLLRTVPDRWGRKDRCAEFCKCLSSGRRSCTWGNGAGRMSVPEQ